MTNEELRVRGKSRTGAKVEIAGIEISQALIDSAVAATSDPEKILQVEERERAHTRKIINDSELRVDINVSKQITSALIEQASKPESPRVSLDSLPAALQRVVLAYVRLQEAQEEYDTAVVLLQRPEAQATDVSN